MLISRKYKTIWDTNFQDKNPENKKSISNPIKKVSEEISDKKKSYTFEQVNLFNYAKNINENNDASTDGDGSRAFSPSGY